jgi:hypothetical protein
MSLPEKILAFLAAIAPACLIATILIGIGKGSLPARVRSLALIMGLFAALSSLVSMISVPAMAMLHFPISPSLFRAFFAAALPEETAKFVVLVTIVLRHYEADTRRDAILAGAWLGLGFGVLENFSYVTRGDGWAILSLVRAVTAVPFHVALGAIMGLSLQRFGIGRGWLLALALPILLHGLYDWPAMAIEWNRAALNETSAAYGAVFLLTLVATGYLVSGPVARTLRRTARNVSTQSGLTAGRAFLAGVSGIAGLLRAGASTLVAVALVAAIVLDVRYVALLATAILPFTFAELWRSARV